MKKFILCRIVPLVVLLILVPLGLGAFQSLSHISTEMEPPKQKLTREDAPFKGTDLEPFDMEGEKTAEIVLKAFKAGYPEKISEYGYDAEAQDWFLMAGEKNSSGQREDFFQKFSVMMPTNGVTTSITFIPRTYRTQKTFLLN
ncbi:MAG: hypothetical protein U0I22_04190 [Treponema sp.]|nr:hypothetical protein [Treponema sp.]